jgi:predicted PurR-regulated permease PerM
MKIANIANVFILLFGSIVLLIFGKSLIFPFLFALLVYFLIRAIRRFIDRIPFVKLNIKSWVKNGISTFVIFALLTFTGQMLVSNSRSLIDSFSQYQGNIDSIVSQINQLSGINISETITNKLSDVEMAKMINPILNSITGVMGNIMMVIFYLIFLFIEESNFKKKMHLIFADPEKYDEIKILLGNIEHSITQYIGLKTLISFISSTICFVTLFSFGVNSPLFWASIIFIMNFIPVIGALLAVILPSVFAMIQFGEMSFALILFFLLGTIQTLISNLLEPKLMGDSLNISPLVALIALAFWGAIWGITGMIVSVPITVIIIILLAHFESTKSIAILLSQNGKV